MCNNYQSKLKELEQHSRMLEYDEQNRHQLNQKVEQIADRFLNALDKGNTYSISRPRKNSFKIDNSIHNVEDVLGTLEMELFPHGVNAASGGHLGYIPGGGLYASAIGDYIAAFSNEYSGIYFGSPGAVEIEEACLTWLKEVFEFPESSIGNLTSGGSIANLIALTAARDAKNVMRSLESEVIYLTAQVHHCVHKALRIIGLSHAKIRTVKMDENGRMKVDHLSELIKEDSSAGLNPFLLIGSAGTTDVGAIDPLSDMANVAQENDMWFHVDAAYGGFFKLLPELKSRFKGLERADSLVIDPHKGLFLPYGLGAVLVKDREAVFESHHYSANYMQDAFSGDVPISPADVSPELTKHFRALRMWLPLQLHGLEPFRAGLQEKIVLTHYFRHELQKLDFCIGPEPDLSVSYFWYPRDNNQNDFNKKLIELCHEDGRVFLSSTLIDGKFVIRMAILSFRTHKDTIDRAIEMIKDQLYKLI